MEEKAEKFRRWELVTRKSGVAAQGLIVVPSSQVVQP